MPRKTLTRVQVKEAEKGEIEALFSRFGVVDYDGDWTEPTAFEDGAAVTISAYGHGSWGSGLNALPVGKGVIRVTPEGAILDGRFFLSTPQGQATFATIKEMSDLQELSYGYDVLKRGELTDDLRQKGARRVLAKLKVHEVSPVLVGAGIETGVLAVKCVGCGADGAPPCGHCLRELAVKELARFERTRARLLSR